jgi:hypothetical protein
MALGLAKGLCRAGESLNDGGVVYAQLGQGHRGGCGGKVGGGGGRGGCSACSDESRGMRRLCWGATGKACAERSRSEQDDEQGIKDFLHDGFLSRRGAPLCPCTLNP